MLVEIIQSVDLTTCTPQEKQKTNGVSSFILTLPGIIYFCVYIEKVNS